MKLEVLGIFFKLAKEKGPTNSVGYNSRRIASTSVTPDVRIAGKPLPRAICTDMEVASFSIAVPVDSVEGELTHFVPPANLGWPGSS